MRLQTRMRIEIEAVIAKVVKSESVSSGFAEHCTQATGGPKGC